MVVYIAGILLSVLGICLSVALHEAGHMVSARVFGMKVRRFFVGMGPTLFSFRWRGTEYGLKAVPTGGFCDISGMTTLDNNVKDERPMWKFKPWQRTVVMASGPLTHFVLGFLILYVMAMTVGLPNTAGEAILNPTDGGAAAAAGIRSGDRVLSVADKRTPTWSEVVTVVRNQSGATPIEVQRDSSTLTFTVNIPRVYRQGVGEIGVIGASAQATLHYNPISAVGEATAFTGQILTQSAQRLIEIPQTIPALAKAIIGGERDPNTPVSVVGASRLGEEAVEAGLWSKFILVLAGLNFSLGLFNLLPLLPLDGGHIAVTWYEKVRDEVRHWSDHPPLGPVNYTRLLTLTMALVIIGGLFAALTVTADIVNPIRLT